MKIISIHRNKLIWDIYEELLRFEEKNAKPIDPNEPRRLTITVEDYIERRSGISPRLKNALLKNPGCNIFDITDQLHRGIGPKMMEELDELLGRIVEN